MNGLRERIAALILADGPMSVADYMTICLLDPEEGYYTSKEPFGQKGDFITAPEISQMFGELVGIWLVQAWRAGGSPSPVTVAEIGPGRGTLMKDMVRTIGRIAPDLAEAASFVLVEASARLREIQKQTLSGSVGAFAWHETLDSLSNAPLLVVGNEFFDALPFRQFVRRGGSWREHAIGVSAEGTLRFGIGTAGLAEEALPDRLDNAPEGSVFEKSPAREALMAKLAAGLARKGGAALFFDYGHLEPGFGDTFQAVRNHKSENVLANPGKADLTSHVDFSALAAVARSAGMSAHMMTQGEFLLAMGLLERAGRLGRDADADMRARIKADVERLAGSGQMGELFKVLAVLPKGVSVPPFASAS